MISENWRSPDAYAYLSNLDAAEFAFEFLRRHPDYQSEFDQNARGATEGEPDKAADLSPAPRWGLACFRRSKPKI